LSWIIIDEKNLKFVGGPKGIENFDYCCRRCNGQKNEILINGPVVDEMYIGFLNGRVVDGIFLDFWL